MASLLQRQVYQAFLNAGLSDNQARIITAEVGREGSFSPKNLFGVHIDPKNRAANLGMLSWQGSRGRALYRDLKSQGLIQGNGIAPSQKALDTMARFSVNEMRTNKAYSKTARIFLNNPNVDYQTGAAVLGRNYVRWRYDDPMYKSGHANRNKFYQAMGGQTLQQQNKYIPDFIDLKSVGIGSKNSSSHPQMVDLASMGISNNKPNSSYQPEFIDLKSVGIG